MSVTHERECLNCELYQEQARLARARAAEAIQEAAVYRQLWEAAASCIAANAGKIRPRGDDEKKLINEAINGGHGPFWSGTTRGRL